MQWPWIAYYFNTVTCGTFVLNSGPPLYVFVLGSGPPLYDSGPPLYARHSFAILWLLRSLYIDIDILHGSEIIRARCPFTPLMYQIPQTQFILWNQIWRCSVPRLFRNLLRQSRHSNRQPRQMRRQLLNLTPLMCRQTTHPQLHLWNQIWR